MGTLAKLAILVLAILAAVTPVPAAWVETVYSRKFYPALQTTLTPLSNRVSFAVFDVAAVLVALVVLWWIVRLFGSRGGRIRALARLTLNTAVLAALIYLAFVIFWGFNYRREPLASRLDFDSSRVTEMAVEELARMSVDEMNALAATARNAPLTLDDAPEQLGPAFERALAMLGQAPAVPGRPKRSLLDPYFQRAAVDGMTDPFFLEALVREDLLPFERPFAVAHEWAHLAGFANESEAGFVAWLTSMHAGEAARYSAWMQMYLQTIGDLDESQRADLGRRLSALPREDLAELYRQYQGQVWPTARDAGRVVYDRFLKANRVQEGIRSYDEVVRLVLGTRFEEPHVPVLKTAGNVDDGS